MTNEVEKRLVATWLTKPPLFRRAAMMTLLCCALLFLGAALYWQENQIFRDLLPANRELVFEKFEFWRLFTTLVAHADLGHLLANLSFFAILAYLLFGYFGVWVFPVVSVLLAAVANLIALSTYPSQTFLIGASGLVHLMGGVWISLYFLISRNHSISGRLLRSIGAMLTLFFPKSFDPQVSYRVHFIGLLLGLVYGAWYFWRHQNHLRAAEHHIVIEQPDLEQSLPPH